MNVKHTRQKNLPSYCHSDVLADRGELLESGEAREPSHPVKQKNRRAAGRSAQSAGPGCAEAPPQALQRTAACP